MLRILLTSLFISGCGAATTNTTSTDSCGKTTAEQTGLKICSFVATPTLTESITLKNYGTTAITLTGYTIWDSNAYTNASGQKTLQSTDIISAGSTLTITTGGSPFVINDSGETMYLKDPNGSLIDSKSN
jgi:hypothetical protein